MRFSAHSRLCLGAWSDHGERTGGFYACNRYESAKKEGVVCLLFTSCISEKSFRRTLASIVVILFLPLLLQWD
jgi:hypothetical protein